MPPVIRESDEDEGYSEMETSSVAGLRDEEEGERLNSLRNYADDQDSDLSDLSDAETAAHGAGLDDFDEDGSSDVNNTAAGLEEDEDDDDDEELASDDEDNRVVDPDDMDDDLELPEEEPEVAPHKPPRRAAAVKAAASQATPARETRKRKLTFYEEDEEDFEDEEDEEEEYEAVPKRLGKQRKAPERRVQPTDIDEDLILTDEEAEYNPHANPDLSKMTERQRARYLEEVDSNSKKFVELDDNYSKNKKTKLKRKETEEQAALRKAENARKRLDYKNKQLEEEKRDTLNKLLKRRANKTREVDPKEGAVDVAKLVLKGRRPMMQHPALMRWVLRKEGQVLGIPE